MNKHLVGKKKQIKNAVGIKREILKKSEAMAHILQGYERLILDTLISNSEPNDVALLVHDCIVYYTPKSVDKLSRIVKEKTGFDLEISEKQYWTNNHYLTSFIIVLKSMTYIEFTSK